METRTLLSLEITVSYPQKPEVLRNLALEIREGEILGLVGQSGCGKSTLALAILNLLHLKRGRAEGSIYFQGRDLLELPERDLRALRGREIALVPQSPMSALNPALRIQKQLEEAWRVHRRGSRAEYRAELFETLEAVSLPTDKPFLRRYPAQLSVGQAQRVLIAMAILHRPALLIADEPTSALDIITQSEILELFSSLSQKLAMSILCISHELLAVARICNRMAVIEQGQILECRDTADIFRNPLHPYTRALVGALPLIPEFSSRAASAP
jgi:ABC-type glutathione transport system ATPase component